MTLKPQKLSPGEQWDLESRLTDAARYGHTEIVQTVLAASVNVHVRDDLALCLAAAFGHTQTVRALLLAGADVHVREDYALRWAACGGHTGTVPVLARHIFAPASWQGKNRAEIEAYANALYDKIKGDNPPPERLRQAGAILIDSALCCWEQVRPAPPKIQISPLPAQPW